MKHIGRIFDGAPHDMRLTVDRHTDTIYPITRFSSREAVLDRREVLRFSLRMAAGLYPWPEKCPLEVRREVAMRVPGCVIEKVMFQTKPGFWSTGNLYWPERLESPAPAILNVIGHWEDQRLTRIEAADYPQQLVNFARMGFVCLVTDMIGKVDSRQITHDYGAGEKELWCSNGLGVQLWNNIRALDLLQSLPEVDATRIGVTGASGGGSQTLFLALADDRVSAAAPINMISLQMQGGCQCENAPGLRRHTDNTEMCSVLAPRPLFLAGSTGDWTSCQENWEYPAIRDAYALFGKQDLVEHYYQVADHQYNARTRRRVYSFFARHLMGRNIEWDEQALPPFDVRDLTWFRSQGSAPGLQGDDAFYEAHKAERTEALQRLTRDEKLRALRWVTGIDEGPASLADGDTVHEGHITIEKTVLTGAKGQMLPVVRMIPDDWDNQRVVLMLSGRGKACLDGAAARDMLAGGAALVGADLFMTGEYRSARIRIGGGAQGKKYFTTFNDTVAMSQCQDVALLWQIVKSMGGACTLRAEGKAARAAACALPLLTGVTAAVIDRSALDADDQELARDFLLPGLKNIGGFEGCLNLAACPVQFY